MLAISSSDTSIGEAIGNRCTTSWLFPGIWPLHCYDKGVFLRCFLTPPDVRSTSDQTQFASDLASDLRSEAPFHSKQSRRKHDPGLLCSLSMVLNLCFWKQQPFFAHNFNRKSIRYSILSLQVASLPMQCNVMLLVERIFLCNQTNFLYWNLIPQRTNAMGHGWDSNPGFHRGDGREGRAQHSTTEPSQMVIHNHVSGSYCMCTATFHSLQTELNGTILSIICGHLAALQAWSPSDYHQHMIVSRKGLRWFSAKNFAFVLFVLRITNDPEI